jgi:hypothetical protein
MKPMWLYKEPSILKIEWLWLIESGANRIADGFSLVLTFDIPCTFLGASPIKIIALHRSTAGPSADTSGWHQPCTLWEQRRKIGSAPERRR